MSGKQPWPTCATCVWFERDRGYRNLKTGECRFDDKDAPGEPVNEKDWCEMYSLMPAKEPKP